MITEATELDTIQEPEGAGQIRDDLCASVTAPLEAAGTEVRYSAERARVMAERTLGKARRQIQDRPLAVLAAAVVGCLAVGLTAGWFISFRRSK